jgi:hypothetical protein
VFLKIVALVNCSYGKCSNGNVVPERLLAVDYLQKWTFISLKKTSAIPVPPTLRLHEMLILAYFWCFNTKGPPVQIILYFKSSSCILWRAKVFCRQVSHQFSLLCCWYDERWNKTDPDFFTPNKIIHNQCIHNIVGNDQNRMAVGYQNQHQHRVQILSWGLNHHSLYNRKHGAEYVPWRVRRYPWAQLGWS